MNYKASVKSLSFQKLIHLLRTEAKDVCFQVALVDDQERLRRHDSRYAALQDEGRHVWVLYQDNFYTPLQMLSQIARLYGPAIDV